MFLLECLGWKLKATNELLNLGQARPEIIIKGALEYDGENTAWREYEVSTDFPFRSEMYGGFTATAGCVEGGVKWQSTPRLFWCNASL